VRWVADVVAANRETVEVGSLRADGGLTNEPLIAQRYRPSSARSAGPSRSRAVAAWCQNG
jgi:hypothetical protein